jgi:DNA-binding transcriptional regulator GbsR (MarR family)
MPSQKEQKEETRARLLVALKGKKLCFSELAKKTKISKRILVERLREMEVNNEVLVELKRSKKGAPKVIYMLKDDVVKEYGDQIDRAAETIAFMRSLEWVAELASKVGLHEIEKNIKSKESAIEEHLAILQQLHQAWLEHIMKLKPLQPPFERYVAKECINALQRILLEKNLLRLMKSEAANITIPDKGLNNLESVVKDLINRAKHYGIEPPPTEHLLSEDK